ncbi:MMPL family transporter [Actinomadura sp. KC06]|uniref:MMPL family transporter n=1 Tax=Actinomadura sp. KC06 TaxID=2530369 RepID=UPI00104CC46C|nr:MMPL family transporter [Actinomadura sp. KC06]TDD33910.1 MMPL family transporter [Actinomadura sp. KC06]
MFAGIGRAAVRLRWTILALAGGVLLVASTWGTTVFTALTDGGFDDPKAEAQKTIGQIDREVGPQRVDLLVMYSSGSWTVDDPRFKAAVAPVIDRLGRQPEVERVLSFQQTGAPVFVAEDRKATYLALTLRGKDNNARVDSFKDIEDALKAPGLAQTIGGPVAVYDDLNVEATKDVGLGESITLPILLVLLVFIFRSAVAALLPLAVGGMAILGGFLVTRLLTYATDISIFSVNVIILLGLGLGIDYALFIVSRFREELARGRDVPEAVRTTMATAGRTVAVSGLILSLALSALLLFPQPFLRSMGMGGIGTVVVAAVSALTVLPALLAVLGPRVDSWRVPLPGRRRREARPATGPDRWIRLGTAVTRRPVIFAAASLALLVVMALPLLHIRLGAADERMLPSDARSRVTAERIAADFPAPGVNDVDVLVSGADPAAAQRLGDGIRGLRGVENVRPAAARGSSTLFRVSLSVPPTSDRARALVTEIRELPAPPGGEVMVGGTSAALVDRLDGLGVRLPVVGAILTAVMLFVLFIAFRSVLLPIKAVLMNGLSIAAALGVVVWGFQDGHLAGVLGFTSTGELEANQLILIFTLLFGLSLDYEVFLVSRMREEWDRTGDNSKAIIGGLQRSGSIITAAALLLIVVIGGFALGGVTFMKMTGVGGVVAIAIDATIIRLLLSPALMQIFGKAGWWAPFLGRTVRPRRETDPADEDSVGRSVPSVTAQ